MLKYYIVVITMLLSLITSCGDKSSSKEKFIHIPRPDDSFTTPVLDEEYIVSASGAQFPVNQVIIMIAPETEPSQAVAIAQQFEGEIIGQIPSLGLYQVRVSSTTEAELNTVINSAVALPEVLAAFENGRRVLSINDACYDTSDDNHNGWDRKSRCALSDVQYFSLVPILKEFEGFSTVRFANIEYVNLDTNQFNDVTKVIIGEVKGPIKPEGHGTATAGIIAADQGDRSVGGIVSTLLKDKLELILSSACSDMASCVEELRLAIEQGQADVVNMSYGWGIASGHNQRTVDGAILAHTTLMRKFSEVIFITAAGNKNIEITANNDCMASIVEPNLITVGGTAWCDPNNGWYDSNPPLSGTNYGVGFVDVAAPGEKVPIIGYLPERNYTNPLLFIRMDGTSFSAPIVASLAAVLLSIDPTLTPEQIKAYIIDESIGTDLDGDGVLDTPRVQLAYSVQKLLYDIDAPGARELFDPNENGESDTTGLVVHRICGGSSFSIETEGLLLFPPDGDSALSLSAGSLSMTFADDEENNISLMGSNYIFRLGEPMEWGEEFLLSFVLPTEDGEEAEMAGTSIPGSGVFELYSCIVTERNGMTNMPLSIEVTGRLQGSFELRIPPEIPPLIRSFIGNFTLPMITLMSSPAELDTIENTCVGGIYHFDK
jgi:Subtilase family